jgi:hypothetical protein
MSRIERYQIGINNFIINKTNIEDEIKNKILKADHLLGIIMASLINVNTKKTNYKVHGYYSAAGIDLLLLNIIENNLLMLNNIYLLFHTNFDIIKFPTCNDTSVKILKFGLTYLSTQLNIIFQSKKYEEQKRTLKSDILNLENITKIKIKDLNVIKKEDFNSFLNDKYGTVGEIIFILGWTIGGGEIKAEFMKELQLMGNKLGIIYKIARDFEKLEEDINNSYIFNIVLNNGIQDSFTIFMDLKTEFLQALFTHNLYTHTIKEILDLFEDKIDLVLRKSNIDMKSTYSTFSSK